MARRGATKHHAQERRPANPGSGTGATSTALGRGLLVALGLDALIAAVQLYVHAQLSAGDGSYTSFCNVNSSINCDAVLGSQFAMLFGVPISLWALAKDAAIAALVAFRGRPGSPARLQSALALAFLGAWTLVFSLYMALVATSTIGAFCLLCAGMYVLSPLIAVLAWRVAEARLGAAGPVVTPARAGAGAGAIAVSLAVVAAAQFNVLPGTGPLTVADVRERDPEFFLWYSDLKRVGPLPEARHAKGPIDAPITIVEFSDFECTFCAKAFRDLRDLERQYPDQIRVVFHHYPLDSACNPHVTGRMHEAACLAAIAAECAARAGAFWTYHDRLFEAQDDLARPALITMAADLGIDTNAFTACLDDPSNRGLVLADADAGAGLGVQSTPTLIINGRSVEGALDRSKYDYVVAMELQS